MNAPLLETRDLSVSFRVPGHLGRPARLQAVNGVSLSIERGRTLALVGESGSGKSTTGRAVLQLVEHQGEVLVDGVPMSTMSRTQRERARQDMQLVFQDPYGSLDPRMSVEAIVGESLRLQGVSKRETRDRVREIVHRVGLTDEHLDRRPHEFSGGQRQRVAIARALVGRPRLVVCDEPVSALDVRVQAAVLDLFRELQDAMQLSYLFISHDLAVVKEIADRVAVLYLGRVVETFPADTLGVTVAHPYTAALVSAIPQPDPRRERRRERIILQGDPPSPFDLPDGCAFRSRCWLYEALGRPERCAVERPELAPIGSDSESACHFPDEVMPAAATTRRAS